MRAPQARRKETHSDLWEALKHVAQVLLGDDKENNLSATISPWKLNGFKPGIALESIVI